MPDLASRTKITAALPTACEQAPSVFVEVNYYYAHIGSHLTLSRPAHRIPLTESFQEICSSRQEVLDSKRTVVPGIWCTVSVQRPMPVLGYRAHRAGAVAEQSDSLGKRITVLGDQLPCVVSFMPLRIVLDTTGS